MTTASSHDRVSPPAAATAMPGVPPAPARPWWKHFYVWMVISGPLSVVIACAVTSVYILQGPDALVSEDYYREGQEISRQLKTAPPPMEPALTGRNHSATGGQHHE
ncbi:MAG: FixH family protein [Polaromonas sp.]|nr:FixH family protein [Polaromonas sp.]